MNRRFAVVALLLGLQFSSASNCFAQQDACTNTYVIDLVKTLMDAESGGFSSTFNEKQNIRLGDRAAITLLKIYSIEELLKPTNFDSAMAVMKASFSCPKRCIEDAHDRKPDVTFALLDLLSGRGSDSQKQKIVQLRSYIQEQTTR